MPTYDYECDACGHEFELFQGINDPVQRKCPKCGKLKLRRLFGTGAAVVFKGWDEVAALFAKKHGTPRKDVIEDLCL